MNAAPRKPAANAVKHGFCSTRFVPEDVTALAEKLRIDLLRMHEPASTNETDCVEELATNKARLNYLERAFDELQKAGKARAADAFDRESRTRFQNDLAAFQANPSLYAESLGDSFRGVEYLHRIWSRIEECMKPGGPGISAEQARLAAALRGSRWQVATMSIEGAWIMTRFVKTSLEPKAELDRWIADSGGPTDRSRAEWFVRNAPDREVCRRELAAEAAAQRNHWSLLLKDLRSDYETERAAAAERFVGILPGDAAQCDEFRLILRYLTSTRNRVDRIERRLDSLKKGRQMAAWRAQRDADREARKQSRAERRRESEIRQALDPETPAPQYRDPETETRIAGSAESQSAPTIETPDVDDLVVEVEPAPATPVIPVQKPLRKPAEEVAPTIARTPQDISLQYFASALRNEIESLADEFGIDFDALEDPEPTDDCDVTDDMTPEEKAAFEAWRLQMERSIRQEQHMTGS